MEELKGGFEYTIEHLDRYGTIKSVEIIKNIMPTVALNHILSATLLGASQYTSWYLGLYTASYSPVAGDTMTSLIGACSETSAYGAGTNRDEITFPSASAGAVTTAADPNVLTFTANTTVTGGFITSGITIGGTTGILLSAVQFSSPKIIESGESLRVPLGITLASA